MVDCMLNEIVTDFSGWSMIDSCKLMRMKDYE